MVGVKGAVESGGDLCEGESHGIERGVCPLSPPPHVAVLSPPCCLPSLLPPLHPPAPPAATGCSWTPSLLCVVTSWPGFTSSALPLSS